MTESISWNWGPVHVDGIFWRRVYICQDVTKRFNKLQQLQLLVTDENRGEFSGGKLGHCCS